MNHEMNPRVVIGALRGGSGKTLFCIGLCSLWKKQGKDIAPFKKGPDYIDAAWLGMAAGKACRHLDPYLMSEDRILRSYGKHGMKAGAVIEGNRGLYDGVDEEGSCSTAQVAKLLHAPVVVVIDATKTTRTAAAVVLGLKHLDPEVDIRGVVLNRVGGKRHETILRNSIERYAGVKVLGSLPRFGGLRFPERYFGLVPPEEHHLVDEVIERAARIVSDHVDTDAIWEIALSAGPLSELYVYKGKESEPQPGPLVKIGWINDQAFHFYYPENLEALENRNGEIVPINSLEAETLPDVDALYIGGGFPERFAQALSDNTSFRTQIRRAVVDGLPVYAECGGLMYLGRSIRVGVNDYPMVGALPVHTELLKRPQGHGYTLLEAVGENPFYPRGSRIKGHEFHYSKVRSIDEAKISYAFRVKRGTGINGRDEGIVLNNVLATYTHVHALGSELWGEGMARSAATRLRKKNQNIQMGVGLS